MTQAPDPIELRQLAEAATPGPWQVALALLDRLAAAERIVKLLEARMDAAEDVIFAYDDRDHATKSERVGAEQLLKERRATWGDARRAHGEALQP